MPSRLCNIALTKKTHVTHPSFLAEEGEERKKERTNAESTLLLANLKLCLAHLASQVPHRSGTFRNCPRSYWTPQHFAAVKVERVCASKDGQFCASVKRWYALIPGERRRFGIRTGLGRATRKVYDMQAPCGQSMWIMPRLNEQALCPQTAMERCYECGRHKSLWFKSQKPRWNKYFSSAAQKHVGASEPCDVPQVRLDVHESNR